LTQIYTVSQNLHAFCRRLTQDVTIEELAPLFLQFLNNLSKSPLPSSSLEEYRRKRKAKSGFIIELLKGPKIMLIGREDDL
jgi:hypothetical protein